MGEVTEFPPIPRHPHSFKRDGDVDVSDMDKLCWIACAYFDMAKGGNWNCKQCPEMIDDPQHGPVYPGCRLIAQELVNICQTGNPWRTPNAT